MTPPAADAPALAPRTCRVVAGVLLLVQFVLGTHAAGHWSPTHDEFWHLPAGLLVWRTGRFDFDRLTPPLTRVWAALPAAVTAPPLGELPAPGSTAGLGDMLVAASPDNFDGYYRAGRIMNLLLTAGIGVGLYFLIRSRWGEVAALLGVAVWSLGPNVLATGALVTSDMGTAAAFLAVWAATNHWARRRTWAAAAVVGVLFGAAQLCKFSSLLLVPLIPMWFVLESMAERLAWKAYARRVLGQSVLVLLLGWTVLCAGYLFEGIFRPLRDYPLTSRPGFLLKSFPGGTPVPLPADYLLGLDAQQKMLEGEHPVYLLDQWSLHGFRTYYLHALLWKVPHAVQLLMVLALVRWAWLWRTGPRDARQPLLFRFLSLTLPMALILFIASFSGMQLGVRYLFPVFPYAVLLIAPAAAWLGETSKPMLRVATLAACLLLPLSLRYHPDHIAYFNEAAGGPDGGRWVLLDSNLDWGQDLKPLARLAHSKNWGTIGLAYFGTVKPSAYGLDYTLPPQLRPSPGRYAISANYVQGRPHTLLAPDGRPVGVGSDAFGYFRFFEPKYRVGHSIDVYELSDSDVSRYFAALREAGGS